MSKAPAMPVFTDALIGDTTHLSAEEFGAYCLILFATWRNNGEPFTDSSRRLSRICRVTEARWRSRLRPVLVGFFDLDDHRWRQKRLEKEWKYVAELSASQSEKGKLSGEARRLKSKETDRTAVPPRFEPEWEPNANPHTHTQKEREESIESPVGEVVLMPRAREPRADGYAFEGKIIRLTNSNLEEWRKSFAKIRSIEAELCSLDAWLVQHKHDGPWFHKVAGMLARRCQEIGDLEAKRKTWPGGVIPMHKGAGG